MEPGIYVVRQDEPEYGPLAAMVVEGQASFVGERYDVDARKEIAVQVPAAGGHSDNFALPLAEPGTKPGKEEMYELADDYLVERRRGYGRRGTGKFYVFRGDYGGPDNSSEDLQDLIDAASRDIEHSYDMFEIRDDAGDPVWRSRNFKLPLSTKSTSKLRPLRDADDEATRVERALATEGAFTSFSDYGNSAWSYNDSLKILKKETLDEMKNDKSVFFEIRDKKGAVVWRSPNFEMRLQ